MTVNAILRQGSVFRTAPLTQYDEGQKIHLSGVELPASYLAEFANSEFGTAEQVTQTTDTVTVPDKYLTSENPVYVWIVVVGQDERTTRYQIIVPVNGRGEPDNYTPMPSEQTAIEAAITALNEAVTAAGVAIEHYPQIVGGIWQVWDVTNGTWVSTGVGATGNGIAGATLNGDYTLTLTFTDGTSYTTPSIQGSPGPGVPAGGTTGQMLVKKSATDYDSEWQNQPSVPVQDVQVNGTSILNNGVANIPYASTNPGVVKVGSGGANGITIGSNGYISTKRPSDTEVKEATNLYKPIVPSNQHTATFYGLSKVAGVDLANETVTLGTYPEASKLAIEEMLATPSSDDTIYLYPQDFTSPTTASSNASTVINAAITAAATAGKHYVILPAGEYWLTATIYLKSEVILKGSGMDATTLKIADGCDIDAIRVAGPINNSGIMDLSIDGNRITNYSTFNNGHHGNAINVWLHYGRIERVRTNWVYKHSLLLNYDTGNSDDGLGFDPEHQNDMGNLNKVLWCDFRDSLLQGVMWGWRTMDSWMCYTNIGSHAANLYLEGGTSRFIGNHFDGDGDNGAGPEYNVYCGDGCTAMLFDGNIFENTQKENIYFRKPSYSNQSRTISITNNIIRTCSKSTNNTYPNIFISGYGANAEAEQIIIGNNQILNPDTNANHGPSGIHLDYCKDVKISGNTYFNVGANEVVIGTGCSNISNDDNFGTVQDVQVDGTSVVDGQGVADIPLDSKADVIISSASGAIASFADGANNMPLRECVVQIEPVQDLHGYENPWPGGGGANKWDEEWEVGKYNTSSGLPDTSDSNIRGKNRIAVSAETTYSCVRTGNVAVVILYYNASDEFISSQNITSNLTFTAPANCAYIRFYCGVAYGTTYNHDIAINYPATVTTYAPYSNICPITGWTGANVARYSVNIWDEQWENGRIVYGVNNPDAGIRSKNHIIIKPNTQYRVIKDTEKYSGNLWITFYDKNKRRMHDSDHDNPQGWMAYNTGVMTTPPGAYSMRFSVINATEYTGGIGFNYPSTDTYYHPGTGDQVYPITFPSEAGTVYGGTLTVNEDGTGQLVVDRASMTFTGANDENWLLHGSIASWFYIDNVLTDPYVNNAENDFALSNMYIQEKYNSATTMTTGTFALSIVGQQNTIRLAIKDTRFVSASDFKQALASQNLVVAYELATPITYQLTNQQVIETLKGVNNIWADTGDTAVTYPADTKAYVDDAIPSVPVQDVQINGTSILSNGVANVPVAGTSNFGCIKVGSTNTGLQQDPSGYLKIIRATGSRIRDGADNYLPIVPSNQHSSVFFGLAKSAGDSTQSASSNPVGTYTDEAKAAIWNMLGLDGSAFIRSDWELINEVTTTEDLAQVSVTTDSYGGAFELSEIYVRADLPPTTTGTMDYISATALYNTESSTGSTACPTLRYTSATDKLMPVYHASIINGIVEAQGRPGSRWNSTQIVQGISDSTSTAKSIYGFRLSQYNSSSTLIPSGTKIYIYGKRKRAALDSAVINVSGSTPSITALPGHRYVCGECATLNITIPVSGCFDVTFESGSTPTVLTATGVTWPDWFDATALEANRTYELNICDGRGAVMSWT